MACAAPEWAHGVVNPQGLSGDKLAASDSAIGHVKDFYFDNKTWVILYLAADTGSIPCQRGKLGRSKETIKVKT